MILQVHCEWNYWFKDFVKSDDQLVTATVVFDLTMSGVDPEKISKEGVGVTQVFTFSTQGMWVVVVMDQKWQKNNFLWG